MNLLEKFDHVEIQSDQRISESDRKICEAHQNAYKNAATTLQELSCYWESMIEMQTDLLEGTGSEITTYLSSHECISLSMDLIHAQIIANHTTFINSIVSYFNKAYHTSIPCICIVAALIPPEPEKAGCDRDAYKEKYRQYEKDLLELSLNYKDILEQIFIKMDGRDFVSQALYELKERCCLAAWFSYRTAAKFEQQKNILRFQNYGCNYSYRYSEDVWTLSKALQTILYGIAHFETGSFTALPCGFFTLLGYQGSKEDTHKFTGCKKIEQLKMFKNGRVDIRFTSEAYAGKFIEDYLMFPH